MNDLQLNLLKPDDNFIPEQPKRKKGRLFVLGAIAVAVIVITSFSVRQYSISQWPTDPEMYDPITLKPKSFSFMNSVKNMIFKSDNILVGQKDDRINILLLGMGGPGHDGPYLTDTNIVFSLKPSTGEAAMLSIPRDLGVNIPGYGLSKINHANSVGESKKPGQGGDSARQVFADTFKIDIPYYVRVDFKAFVDLINTVGGITINVERPFSDYMFPGENFSYQTLEFAAGAQTMNGERALQYARSRHGTNGEGSDFARSKRQQQVISALKDKMLSFGTYTNPMKLQKILGSLSEHVSTNLDFGQIMYLAGLGKDVQDIKTMVLDNSTNGFLYNTNSPTSGYLLLPKEGDFKKVTEAFNNIFNEQAPAEAEKTNIVITPEQKTVFFASAKIEVQNGTWIIGLASRMEKRLKESGFTVNTVGNSIKRPISKTSIYLINPAISKEITSALSTQLGSEVWSTLPEWLNEGYNKDTDILVILGQDTNE